MGRSSSIGLIEPFLQALNRVSRAYHTRCRLGFSVPGLAHWHNAGNAPRARVLAARDAARPCVSVTHSAPHGACTRPHTLTPKPYTLYYIPSSTFSSLKWRHRRRCAAADLAGPHGAGAFGRVHLLVTADAYDRMASEYSLNT